MLIKIVTYIIFVVIWCSLAGFRAEPISLLFMAFAPLVTLLLVIALDLLPKKNHFKFSAVIYFGWLLKEVLISSIAVSKMAFRKNIRLHPVLETIKTIQNNHIGTVIYGNSITLTPGTVTLSTKNEYLLIHALDVSFMEGLKEGEMDNRVKEIIK